jgi:N-acetylglucosamine-6-phosphate deacetylase
VGIYLEGPFLSADKLGAQNPAYVKAPDVAMARRLQAAAGGLVKLLAVAPEVDGAMELIDALGGEIWCTLAHTTADYETASEALRRGAKQITHSYNAMPPSSHREPGVIGAAMDCPLCHAEIICDNVHIHPSVVRGTMRMFGDDRMIMVSDSMRATGLSDGTYDLGGQRVNVLGNIARLTEGGAIAGSVTNLMNCVRTAVLEMGIPLSVAVKCASMNPARAIGVFDRYGSIKPGKSADLVLLNEDLSIRNVFLRGKQL